MKVLLPASTPIFVAGGVFDDRHCNSGEVES
jgi:hypothetical protein